MAETINTRCCIAGGGPAGMMLGLLLARAGIDVVVLEKHADFLRDFRGDTVHPSTLEVVHELGLLDDFLSRPHQKVTQVGGQVGGVSLTFAEFSSLPTKCKFIAFMPQWDFLDFLADHATPRPNFRLIREAQVTGLLRDSGRVTGVRAATPNGAIEVRAHLTVGADGRSSDVRRLAGLEVMEFGAPMDVLWTRVGKSGDAVLGVFGRIDNGRILVLLDRKDYWQLAYVIPKGSLEEIRARGLQAMLDDIVRLVPHLKTGITEVKSWDDVKLLTVKVDRLKRWHLPGLLCIGDAAHAMSPAGGVGINLAIQDAVAAANLLYNPLLNTNVTEADLRAVQRRRELPTRLTQAMQLALQRGISSILGAEAGGETPLPLPFRLVRRFPWLRRFPARIVGMGFRPEHVRSPGR